MDYKDLKIEDVFSVGEGKEFYMEHYNSTDPALIRNFTYIKNALKRNRILKLGDFLKYSEESLLHMPGISGKYYVIIKKVLIEYGISLPSETTAENAIEDENFAWARALENSHATIFDLNLAPVTLKRLANTDLVSNDMSIAKFAHKFRDKVNLIYVLRANMSEKSAREVITKMKLFAQLTQGKKVSAFQPTNAIYDVDFSWAKVLETCDLTVTDLDLSARSHNALVRRYGAGKVFPLSGFATLFRDKTSCITYLSNLRNIGQNSVEEIINRMKEVAMKVEAEKAQSALEHKIIKHDEETSPKTETKEIPTSEDLTIIQKLLSVWNADIKKQVEQIIEEAENHENNPN